MQLFDTWAGALDPQAYREVVLPHSRRILAALAELGVPRIHFGTDTGPILHLMAAAGPEVVGVDWRTPLDEARRLQSIHDGSDRRLGQMHFAGDLRWLDRSGTGQGLQYNELWRREAGRFRQLLGIQIDRTRNLSNCGQEVFAVGHART